MTQPLRNFVKIIRQYKVNFDPTDLCIKCEIILTPRITRSHKISKYIIKLLWVLIKCLSATEIRSLKPIHTNEIMLLFIFKLVWVWVYLFSYKPFFDSGIFNRIKKISISNTSLLFMHFKWRKNVDLSSLISYVNAN